MSVMRDGRIAMRPRVAMALVALAASLVSTAAVALEVEVLAWTPGPGSAQPSLVATQDGDAVLNWQQRDGEVARLRAARIAVRGRAASSDGAAAADGVRVLPDIARGRDWFLNWADFPSLAVLDNGDWVGFTLRKSAGSSYAYDIHLQRSTDDGATWSRSQVVNDDGQKVQHGFVSLLPDGGDRVLLVWLDGRRELEAGHAAHHPHGAAHHHDDGPMTLRTVVLGRDGVPRAAARLDADTCSCCQTDLARRGGEAIAVYRDHAAGIRDIAMIRRTRDGQWHAPSPVNADGWRMPGCPVNGPAAATNGDALAVAWPTMALGPLEVKLAISPRDGAAFGAPQVIDSGETTLGRVDVAPWHTGGFLVSWVGSEAGSAVLHVAATDARGAVIERVEVTRLPPGRQLGHPRLASVEGRAWVTWTEPTPQGPRVRVARIQDHATQNRE